MRYIVVYRNGEFFFRLVTPEIFINGQNISRLSVFGTQSIASSHYEGVVKLASAESRNDVQEQRLAYSSRFLVLSNTAIFFTVSGMTFSRYF